MRAEDLQKAIRAKCLECCGQSRQEAEKCVITDCPLWAVRGIQPRMKRGRARYEQIDITELYESGKGESA